MSVTAKVSTALFLPQTLESARATDKDQILEVLIGVALKTMSNYADHMSPNELDLAFRSEG